MAWSWSPGEEQQRAINGAELTTRQLKVAANRLAATNATCIRRLCCGIGRVLVAAVAALAPAAISSAEFIRPGDRDLDPRRNMKVARFNPTATLLPDGQVLVAAGAATPRSTARNFSIQLQQAGIWWITPRRRDLHTATLLPDAMSWWRRFFAGSGTASREVYDNCQEPGEQPTR